MKECCDICGKEHDDCVSVACNPVVGGFGDNFFEEELIFFREEFEIITCPRCKEYVCNIIASMLMHFQQHPKKEREGTNQQNAIDYLVDVIESLQAKINTLC